MLARLALLILSASMLTLGCGTLGAPPSAAEAGPATPPERRAQARQARRYAAALEAALDRHEEEVREAVAKTYPSYEEAYAVALRHIEPDLRAFLAEELEARRLGLEALIALSEQDPEFVATQNASYRARLQAVRPHAYAIMGRFEVREPGPGARP